MRLTEQQLRKLIRESFWREKQARDRQEQLPLDTEFAKHIILDMMKRERPDVPWVLDVLIYRISKFKGKDMSQGVMAALQLLMDEGLVGWEGGTTQAYYLEHD